MWVLMNCMSFWEPFYCPVTENVQYWSNEEDVSKILQIWKHTDIQSINDNCKLPQEKENFRKHLSIDESVVSYYGNYSSKSGLTKQFGLHAPVVVRSLVFIFTLEKTANCDKQFGLGCEVVLSLFCPFLLIWQRKYIV